MIVEVFADIAKMAFVVWCLYTVLHAVLRGLQPTLSTALQRQRLVVVAALVLAVLALKVGEDVLGGKSGPIDRSILVFIHAHSSVAMTSVFEVVTGSGSGYFLVPVIGMSAVALWWRQHRHEALLLAVSPLLGFGLVHVVKTLVGRARPDLWPSVSYSGSSFPSGHTLAVAATATAGAIVLTRLWPACRLSAVSAAFVWTALVALSRLVLGVHWPTDVLAAACVGAAIPLLLSLGLASERG